MLITVLLTVVLLQMTIQRQYLHAVGIPNITVPRYFHELAIFQTAPQIAVNGKVITGRADANILHRLQRINAVYIELAPFHRVATKFVNGIIFVQCKYLRGVMSVKIA